MLDDLRGSSYDRRPVIARTTENRTQTRALTQTVSTVGLCTDTGPVSNARLAILLAVLLTGLLGLFLLPVLLTTPEWMR